MYIKGEPFVFTAKQLTDFSGTNPFIPIEDDTSLLEALKVCLVNLLNIIKLGL